MVTTTLTSPCRPLDDWPCSACDDCFAISLGPLFWLAISEIYSLGVRGFAMGIATMASWGFKLLVALTFPRLVEACYWSKRWVRSTFWFIGRSVATLVLGHRFVPERKEWSLKEIIVHRYRFR